MLLTDNQRYTQRWGHLDIEFQPWLDLYRDITDYILPRRGYYENRDGTPTSKAKWGGRIINDAASRANRVLGAGMQGGLSSENRHWFQFSLIDEEFSNWGPVKEWLDLSETVVRKLLSGSNYYTTNHSLYEEQAGFGTGCMFLERDPDSVIRFRLSTAGECRFASSAAGRVDTIYRRLPMTAKQIVGKFGLDRVSSKIKTAFEQKPFEFFNIFHIIEPREQRDTEKWDGPNMRWRSYWFEEHETSKPLLDWGFPYFPAIVSRWSMIRNSPYGLGPGHDVLGHTKMIQEMERSATKGLHREADPPMAFPSKLKDMINLLPGANNYVDIITRDRMVGPMYNVSLNLQQVEYKIARIEQKIEKTYYNDLFLLISATMGDSPQKTATEIMARQEEKILLLGPTVERQVDENLSPTVLWVLGVAIEEMLLPPPPEGVTQEQLKVKFIGPLAQAQQLIDAQSLNTNLSTYERMMRLGDEAAMAVNASINWVEYINKYEETTSMPAGVVRSREDAMAIVEQIVKQQAAAAAAAEQAQQAEMAKTLGQANMKDSALGALQKSVEAF